MKKVTLLGVILILLAFSVVPVMAAGNQGNGHGNGHGNGQGNGVSAGQTQNEGNNDQTRDRDQTKTRDQTRLNNLGRGANRGARGNQNSTRMRTPFYLQGIVTAIKPSTTTPMTDTLTISLIHSSAQVKKFFTTEITITVPTNTQIFQLTQGIENENENGEEEGMPGNRVPITLAVFNQLALNHKVAIHGNVINGVYTARLITLYIQTPTTETSETP